MIHRFCAGAGKLVVGRLLREPCGLAAATESANGLLHFQSLLCVGTERALDGKCACCSVFCGDGNHLSRKTATIFDKFCCKVVLVLFNLSVLSSSPSSLESFKEFLVLCHFCRLATPTLAVGGVLHRDGWRVWSGSADRSQILLSAGYFSNSPSWIASKLCGTVE